VRNVNRECVKKKCVWEAENERRRPVYEGII
jgi:hypothetical protein